MVGSERGVGVGVGVGDGVGDGVTTAVGVGTVAGGTLLGGGAVITEVEKTSDMYTSKVFIRSMAAASFLTFAFKELTARDTSFIHEKAAYSNQICSRFFNSSRRGLWDWTRYSIRAMKPQGSITNGDQTT